ncbi:MAG TPA: hypothetical protein VFC17_06750 [Candidatus Limnocylindrales bacterium]|nr:hypothetical protein [Candidatus Limnocylindrales bacterium]
MLDPKILDSNGRFLYSTADTLCRGKIYLLGLNPGGDPRKWSKGNREGNVRYSFKYLPQAKCAYLEEWDKPAGQHPLQKRICWLMQELKFDIKKVCANNLIFLRSQSAAKLNNFQELADLCWLAHEFILRIVRPKLMLVYGNLAVSPFNYLEKIAKNKTVTQIYPSGHGNWNCRFFCGELAGLKVTVIGLPHLSRFDITKHPRVAAWIRRHL